MESLCPSTRFLQILRNNPEYTAFMKRWQLPVYFQLRFREIIGHLENSLAAYTSEHSASLLEASAVHRANSSAVRLISLACTFSRAIYLAHNGSYRADLQSHVLMLE